MADKEVRALVNHVVMPGDVIGNVADLEASLEGKSKIKFGPGLREENGVILAYKAGVLRHRKPATYLIDCNQRRVCIKAYYSADTRTVNALALFWLYFDFILALFSLILYLFCIFF